MKKIVSAFVMLIGATMLFSGLASAEINFTAYDDSELLNADFDITSGGVYTTMDKVVFWIQVKGQINLNPNENCTTDYTIDMYLKNNQEIKLEVTVYNYGNRDVVATLNVGESVNTLEEGKDYVVSGNKLSFYVDKDIANLGNLDNGDIEDVHFSATKVCSHASVASDDMYWSPSSGSDSGSGGSSTGPGPNIIPGFAFLGFAYYICLGIWLIIAIILALWAYKDAKSKCMDNPAIWFIVVFFLGIIGLIIYLVVRKDKCNKQSQESYYQPPPPPPQ